MKHIKVEVVSSQGLTYSYLSNQEPQTMSNAIASNLNGLERFLRDAREMGDLSRSLSYELTSRSPDSALMESQARAVLESYGGKPLQIKRGYN